ncbi:MAG: hypothetical protein GEU93_06700 [Propionibacteriales bacterium]|nr:hypothetical protein [Propionibacteriales bacterium]
MDVFTYTQWRARGLSRHALKRDLSNGAIRRVIKGVYAAADIPDTLETRAHAVAMIRPRDTVACRQTAA